MEQLNKLNEVLKGKKTYIIALATITTGLSAYVQDQITVLQLIDLIIPALLGTTIRSAIK